MPHTLTLEHIEPVTHDTFRLVFPRPDGFDYTPGQAVDLALDQDGWRDETRPFTMTSQPEDPMLEFVIKTYPDHDGVTRQVATLTPGAQAEISDPWGALADHGTGTFIAAGAGVTPFIAILRRRARAQTLVGCHLVFANKREADIILREEWDSQPALRTSYVVDDPASDLPQGPLGADLLDDLIEDFSGRFYVCGPPAMEDATVQALSEHGVSAAQILREGLS